MSQLPTKIEEKPLDLLGNDPTLTTVVYEHRTGKAFLLDKITNKMVPVQLGEVEGLEALRLTNGHYRSEVKNECKRLYFADVSLREIEERTGVPITVVERWAYRDKPNKLCWSKIKKRDIERVKENNIAIYTTLERKALKKVEEFLESPKSNINTPQDFNTMASGIDKLTKAINVGSASRDKAAGHAQVNVYTQVAPLSPEDARKIYNNDPIKQIVEAEIVKNNESDSETE